MQGTWRLAVTVLAVVAVIALIVATDAAMPGLAACAALMLATGALVDRAWAALVPLGVVLGYAALAGITDPDEAGGEGGWMLVVVFGFVFALGASVCLLIGAGLRHALARTTSGREAWSARR